LPELAANEHAAIEKAHSTAGMRLVLHRHDRKISSCRIITPSV
jgi:hypothetical protein